VWHSSVTLVRTHASHTRHKHTHAPNRYSQHTSKCAQCSAALARIRSARNALQWAAGLAASLALVTAAVAAAANPAGLSTTAAAAAAAAAGGVLGDGGGSSGVVARLLVWLAVAGLCWGGRAWLGRWEGLLLHGDYPPPRNLDKS
jgi:hypothetical protein